MAHPETSREFIELQAVVAGRYSLEREIGRGGMGIVYLARDVALDRLVAIKLLPPALAIQTDLAERFLREARTAARLSHPNIVTVHAVERHDDLAFFVMSYVDGETLGQRVRRAGPLRPREATRLIQEVAWALAYAHANGVVHRDVKPDNILIERTSGRAMVTDFGIARVTDAASGTGPGEMLGTAQYMSPEQAMGEPADARSDLYALGVTAYVALAGRPPFTAANAVAMLAMHVNREPPPLTGVQPPVPPVLAAAVHRCLAKAPAARFESGEALAEAIGAVRGDARETPAVVRQFLTALNNFPLTLAPLLFALVFFVFGTSWLVFGATAVGLFAVIPFIAVVHTARQVLRAGMGIDDVRAALARREREMLEDAEETGLRKRLGPFHTARDYRRAGIGLSLGGALFAVSTSLGDVPLGLRLFNLAMAGLIGFSGLNFLWRSRSARRDGLLLDEPLEGRFARITRSSFRTARAFLKLAGLGMKARPAARPSVSTQPTEVALAAAVEDIFQELPADQRRVLARLPDVVHRLRLHAQQLRLRAAGEAGDDRIRMRLSAVVTALETVRLDLLRLRMGSAGMQTITAALDAAEQIGRRVDAELRGRAEVETLLSIDAQDARERTPSGRTR